MISRRHEQLWTIFKVQVITAALGGFTTLALQVHFDNQTQPGSDWMFGVGLAMSTPADAVAKAFGLGGETSKQFWDVLQLVVNTVICFLVGAVPGWILSLCTASRKAPNAQPTTAHS